MKNPTTEQLNNITIEAFERSYGSLKVDTIKATEAVKQKNNLTVKQIWKGQTT